VAIDPTAPVTPIPPAAPAGSQPNSVVLQAMARAALANINNQAGELAGRPAADAAKTRQGVEHADKASTQDGGRAAATSSPGGAAQALSASRSPPQETRLMRAVRLAATDAVPRQAGLAPLMADVRAVVDGPETPPEVRAAGEALLARLPRDFEMSTARGLRKAVEQSGVFLEARLARGAASTGEGHALPASSSADLKAALLVFRGALTSWLARASPPVQDAEHAEILAEKRSTTMEVDHAVKGAAPLSTTSPQSEWEGAVEEGPSSAPPADLEASPETAEDAPAPPSPAKPRPAFLDRDESSAVARSAAAPLQAPQEDDVEPRFAAFLASPKPAASAQPAKAVSPVLGFLDLSEASTSADEDRPLSPLAVAPLAARGYGGAVVDPGKPRTPPPPFADGPMAGQRPSVSQFPEHVAADEIVRRLLKGASAALARQDLMQIASLREVHHDPETGETRPQPSRLNLDVPFVTPQGVAVAQFEVTRDGGGAGGAMIGPPERTYRVRFSIDVEPLGPVHALVTLAGRRARVSLWAERAETIARLRAGEEALGAALREAELRPEVAIHSGPPPVKDARLLGHFVDQAS
jgi:Flagellar hook-length control protein FliK